MNKLSMAFWFAEPDLENKSSVELHVNVWKIPLSLTDNVKFLDIGLMVRNYSLHTNIFMFVPDPEFNMDNFHDLGACLTDSQNVAFHAVFNERLKIATCSCDKYAEVRRESDSFILYKLDKKNGDVSIDRNKCGGSIIKIKIPEIPGDCEEISNLYFRFRLSGKCIDDSFTQDNLASDALQHYISRIELFDMRVNEVRTLPASLVESMSKNAVKFDKIQFFLMCEAKEELVLAKTGQKSARNLENEIWQNYISSVGKFKENSSIIAYQWSKLSENAGVKKIDDFSMLIKIKLDTISKKKIICAICFVVVLGIISSLIASFLIFCGSFASEKVSHFFSAETGHSLNNESSAFDELAGKLGSNSSSSR